MTTTKAEQLPPLNPDNFSEPMRDVVRWHLLMTEADDVTAATRGLGSVWSLIHEGDYEGARATLDDLKQDLSELFLDALEVLSPSRTTRAR